jgi:ATP synthase protein I
VPDNDKLPSLEELDSSIKKAKARLTRKTKSDATAKVQGMDLAWKICIELLAGIAVGCFIGYYLDLWLNTKPIFFILCFFLGTAGSGLNIYRLIQKTVVNDTNTPKE